MDLKIPDTLHVDAYQMRFANVADVDLERLHALSIAVGWPHRAEDWQYLRELGHGFVALDDIDRVMGSAMWFPHGEHFATLGMLITSPRLQTNGTAKWLMQRVLAECPGMGLRLNATRAARRLYRSLDFVAQQTVFQCQGEARKPLDATDLPAGHEIRQLRPSDLDAVIAFDAPGFAFPRPVHLAKLFESSLCYGLYRGEELRAFSMSRAFGRGYVLGPIAALSPEDAIVVARPHVDAHAGHFLRIDTHVEAGPFASFVQQCGLPVFDTVTTMTLGEGVDYGTVGDEKGALYALASQSMG
ncbi:GCN5-related N-acetyltransferase [Rhizobium sp. PDO1-076]|uniref:GNAT family N-acetyltransferase n=1 Tax=Rhizobium sp. PDO1-076 TaxID=1125979 RepID=UPI00024E2F62|nr:GNAT family N-acetyltransferase [Rhizobium sp. PDO1-076]EHS49715.1 GCN5-related N-acetyltransferase [Rhizobium sp. PDO1-076]